MPNNWKTYKLSELTDVITKGTTPSTYGFGFTDDGINFIKSESTNYDGRLDESSFVKVSKEAHEKLKRSQLKENDILFSMAGAYLGKTGIVYKNHLPANTNQANGIIRVNPNKALPKFVSFILRNPSLINYVNASSGQSAQPNINLTDIGNLDFKLPPLQEQKSIAQILSTIDDKIENNLAINKTLEEMAMALYKHWFVDFGPFLNGEFVASELGLIPKGWEVKNVKYFGEVITGKTPEKRHPEHFGDIIPFVTPTDFKDYGKHIVSANRYISELGMKKLKKNILPVNSLVITCIGSDMGKIAISKVECLTNQQINSLKTEHFLYMYCFFKSNYSLLKRMAGDGTTMPIINKSSFENIKVLFPSTDIINEFEKLINYNDNQILINIKENQTLTQLRDTLLPKLISGEVRIKEFRE